MPNRAPFALRAALAVYLILAAAGSSTAQDFSNRASREFGGLRYTVATDRFLYEPYEVVKMRYTVEAVGDSLFVFRFPHSGWGLDLEKFDALADTVYYPPNNVVLPLTYQVVVTHERPWRKAREVKLWTRTIPRVKISGIVGSFTGSHPPVAVPYCPCWADTPAARLAREYGELRVSPIRPLASGDPAFVPAADLDGNGTLDRAEMDAVWSRFFARLDSLTVPLTTDSTRVSVFIDVRFIDADFDGSGLVDMTDYLLLADRFGAVRPEAGYSPAFDLSGEGRIGFDDFFLFADRFGTRD